jgi:hypothetical protein
VERLNFKRVNFVLLAALVLAMAGAQAFSRHFVLAGVGVAVSLGLFIAHHFRAKHFKKVDREDR